MQFRPDGSTPRNNKLAILCIAGNYRTGKSFLMNHMVDAPPGTYPFQVDPSVHACTRGLWIYSEPQTIKLDGSEECIDVFVMDSEGLGGVDKNQSYDMKIFTLTTLLSSYLVYN